MTLTKSLKIVLATALATAALTVGLTEAVTAGASGTNTTYNACLKSGLLTKVGTAVPTCTGGATEISWNSTTAFGKDTQSAKTAAFSGAQCTIGQIMLTAGNTYIGMPANGQILKIASYTVLFNLLKTKYGGDGVTTFALPNLNAAAPNGLTYTICVSGVYP